MLKIESINFIDFGAIIKLILQTVNRDLIMEVQMHILFSWQMRLLQMDSFC